MLLDDNVFNVHLHSGSVAARLRQPQSVRRVLARDRRGSVPRSQRRPLSLRPLRPVERPHRRQRPGGLRRSQQRSAARPRPACAVLARFGRRAPVQHARAGARLLRRLERGARPGRGPAGRDLALRLAGDDRRRGPRPLRCVGADPGIWPAVGAAQRALRQDPVLRRPLDLSAALGLDLGSLQCAVGLCAVPLRPLGDGQPHRWCWAPGRNISRARSGRRRWSAGWAAPTCNVSISIGGGRSAPPVGWFPLAPREVYVPPYRYSPRYVRNINVTHVTNVTQITTIVNNTNGAADRRDFANRKFPHAVTVVPASVMTSRAPVAAEAARVRNDPQVRSLVADARPVAVTAAAPVAAPPAARQAAVRKGRGHPAADGRPAARLRRSTRPGARSGTRGARPGAGLAAASGGPGCAGAGARPGHHPGSSGRTGGRRPSGRRAGSGGPSRRSRGRQSRRRSGQRRASRDAECRRPAEPRAATECSPAAERRAATECSAATERCAASRIRRRNRAPGRRPGPRRTTIAVEAAAGGPEDQQRPGAVPPPPVTGASPARCRRQRRRQRSARQ